MTGGGAALGGVTWGPDGDTLLFDWGINEHIGPGSQYEFASTIHQYDLSTQEISQLMGDAARPAIGADGTVMSYLTPSEVQTDRA